MFRKGDLVRHDLMPSWGIGSIKYAPRGGNLRIKFEQAGEKILHPGYAELTKVPEDELLYMVIREVRYKRGRPVETISLIPVLKPLSLEVI
jgi:hypothetical protein